jgi:hypothetical protein
MHLASGEKLQKTCSGEPAMTAGTCSSGRCWMQSMAFVMESEIWRREEPVYEYLVISRLFREACEYE